MIELIFKRVIHLVLGHVYLSHEGEEPVGFELEGSQIHELIELIDESIVPELALRVGEVCRRTLEITVRPWSWDTKESG